MRGGVSELIDKQAKEWASSPRAWGCFLQGHGRLLLRPVFPTCVGVFLWRRLILLSRMSLPHVRGGVSSYRTPAQLTERSSPRAWGCFPYCKKFTRRHRVFPTCVGVFPHVVNAWIRISCLPHVRGGVSQTELFLFPGKQSSPRAWGCFPLPAWP